MIRRPLLPAAALCATLALAACNNSPEAGRPDTTPSSTPTNATPTASPTPNYTPEEQTAITAANARYTAARAAIDRAMNDPMVSSRARLEAAGLGGSWLLTAIGDVRSLRESGWYRSGSVQVQALKTQSVNLDIEQPEVRLTSCIDGSKAVIRFQKDKKPVPISATNGNRHAFAAKLVFASPVGKTSKMWFVVEEKTTGPC